MAVAAAQRFRKTRPCPICGGGDDMPRGKGVRCHGYLSDDGAYAHCTRSEHAGLIERHPDSETYPHRLQGECACGVEHGPAEASREPLAVYAYRDRESRIIHETVKLAGKRFRQRRPDPSGNGGYLWNLNGVRRVLYRLDELWAAYERGVDTVHLCEGEKDADAIWRAGGIATTNPEGAGKWRGEFAEMLPPFARVVVVPDLDGPGYRHAISVVRSLEQAGRSVEVRAPMAGKDVSDHLAAGRDLEGLEPWGVEDLERQAAEEVEAEPPPSFPGLSHVEALARQVSPTRQLVEHLVEAGTLGTIAALPETHKSFLALELAHKIVAGGKVLGEHEVLLRGPVGYWWQDDSEENELGRLQDYARRHDHTGELPLRWHLNEGLRLPDHTATLRAEIEAERQVLVVLDSLYNFLPGIDNLKDEEVAVVLAALKAEVCDPTGAALCFVDHAPWPTEGNRGQRRGYGSVFKAAVIRWGLYLQREGEKLYIEARGNNIRGFTRTVATWDEDALELRLLDVERVNEAELDMHILEHVTAEPGKATSKVAEGAERRRENVQKSLERLKEAGLVRDESSRSLGRAGTGTYWFPADHAGSDPSQNAGTGQDALPLGPESGSDPSHSSLPRRGDGSRTGPVESEPGDADYEDEP